MVRGKPRSPLSLRVAAFLWLLSTTWQISCAEDVPSSRWTEAGDLSSGRVFFAAALLPNGKVLATGGYSGSAELDSADLFDPNQNTFVRTVPMGHSRSNHTATILNNGQVLVVGGQASGSTLSSAELYNPSTQTWTATGSLHVARSYHTATLLPDGKVLVTGGVHWPSSPGFAQDVPSGSALDVAELYDPATEKWTVTDSMHTARYTHTATLLGNGDVLVTGGMGLKKVIYPEPERDDEGPRQFRGHPFDTPRYPAFVDALSSAEIYDHKTGTWSSIPSLKTPRFNHTATLLADGNVLVVGGQSNGVIFDSAEVYNVSNRTWNNTGPLPRAVNAHTAALLKDGRVLVAAGADNSGVFRDAEFYNPSTQNWTRGPAMNTLHALNAAIVLPDGRMLVMGGIDALGLPIAAQNTAEIYDPQAQSAPTPATVQAPTPAVAPTLAPATTEIPLPTFSLVNLTGSLLIVTVCVVIITACVVILLAAWLVFVLIDRWRK